MKKYFKLKINKNNNNFIHKNFIKKISNGFTLIETLIALVIFTSSVLGLVAILTTSLSTIIQTKQKIIGTFLAQEGIEYVRNMRDSYIVYSMDGWNEFKDEVINCSALNFCGIDNSKVSTKPGFIFQCIDESSCILYISQSTGNYNTTPPSGTNSGFIRKINIDFISIDEAKVVSEVSWNQGANKIIFSENLFNWLE